MEAGGLTDDRLIKLVEHLSTYDLDRDSVPPDMLGEAYMDLVRHFAEEEGKSGGQFFTPPHIVQLCVRLVDDFADGMTFHDPTVGSGGMLTEAAKYYREAQGGDPSKLTFTGQEINPDIAAIARMNLSLHTLNGEIERGDSLASPGFTDGDDLERFDRVLANFPSPPTGRRTTCRTTSMAASTGTPNSRAPTGATTPSSCTSPSN